MYLHNTPQSIYATPNFKSWIRPWWPFKTKKDKEREIEDKSLEWP